MHQNFIFYTTRCECCQLCTFPGLKAFDGLNQSDGANGYEVLQIFTCIIKFLEDINTKQSKNDVQLALYFRGVFEIEEFPKGYNKPRKLVPKEDKFIMI